jgi:hypothetical protein
MALKNFPYKSLSPLLRKYMDDNECSYTEYLFRFLRKAIKRGFLKKHELLLICNWKSPRTIQKIKANPASKIERLTFLAFQSTDELFIIEKLVKLEGVSIAMASAILMFMNPRKYPVIEIRVWEVLLELKLVEGSSSGKNLNKSNWLVYLEIIRQTAKEKKTTSRKIEKAIFLAHKIHQDGSLY